LKNTITGEFDRKVLKSVSRITKNSEAIFIPTHICLALLHHMQTADGPAMAAAKQITRSTHVSLATPTHQVLIQDFSQY
jgi:hypothetical protein